MELKYKNWKEISINTFKKLQNVISDVPVTDDATLNNINSNIAMLSVLCDVDEDAIASLSTSEYIRLVNDSNFLSDMPKVKITDTYVINGKVYKVFLSLKNMSVAQYIDFQTFYKEYDKYTRELLACFLIPEGKRYGEDYDIAEVITDIGEHLSIVDANSILFFFVILYQSLTKTTLNCSIKDMKKMMRKEKNKEQRMKMEQAIKELKKARDLVTNGNGFI